MRLLDPGSVGDRGKDRVGPGAGNGGHRGDEAVRERAHGLVHEPRGFAPRRGAMRGAQARQFGHQLVEQGGEARHRPFEGGPAPRPFDGDDHVDGAVMKMQAPPVRQPCRLRAAGHFPRAGRPHGAHIRAVFTAMFEDVREAAHRGVMPAEGR